MDEDRPRVLLESKAMICFKCLHVGNPVRCWSKNAAIWYRGGAQSVLAGFFLEVTGWMISIAT